MSANPALRVLHGDRAIFIREKLREARRYLVVSDLHIGFEEKFKISGVSIRTQIEKITSDLVSIVEKNKIDELIIAGDVKSSTDRISPSEWENVPKLLSKIKAICEVSVVPGNHDGGLQHVVPEGVKLLDANGILISGNLVMHGHTRPLMKFSGCQRIVLGHVHPVYQKKGSPLSGKQVWVFAKVQRKNIFRELLTENFDDTLELIFMPAFNTELALAGFAAQTAKQERKIAPILRDMEEVVEAVVVTLDGDIIGDASILPNVL